MDMGMGMVFTTGTYGMPLLWNVWKTDTAGKMAVSCIVILLFGIDPPWPQRPP